MRKLFHVKRLADNLKAIKHEKLALDSILNNMNM